MTEDEENKVEENSGPLVVEPNVKSNVKPNTYIIPQEVLDHFKEFDKRWREYWLNSRHS